MPHVLAFVLESSVPYAFSHISHMRTALTRIEKDVNLMHMMVIHMKLYN